jgi:hypothetical protein
MNKKIIIIAIGILLLILLTWYVVRRGTDSPGYVPYTINGKTIHMRDFKHNLEPVATGADYYLADTDRYSIFYNGAQDEFQISILAEPVTEVRVAAERELLDKLGISQDDACELRVYVTGPVSVDQQFDGHTNLNLTFCN